MDTCTELARRLAPEDIKENTFVAMLAITYEVLPFFCDSAFSKAIADGRPCRMTFLPREEQMQPLKVIAVCLPLVLTTDAHKRQRMLDMRRCVVAQVSNTFGKAYFKAARQQRKREAESKETSSE